MCLYPTGLCPASSSISYNVVHSQLYYGQPMNGSSPSYDTFVCAAGEGRVGDAQETGLSLLPGGSYWLPVKHLDK